MKRAGFNRALAVGMFSMGLVGCGGNLRSGNGENQGVAGPGLSGASAGLATSQGVAGGPLGNVLPPGGSFIIQRRGFEINGGNRTEAATAIPLSVLARKALSSPTADLDGDGFVTIEEVLAMKDAGLTDDEMLERLRATDQVYEPTVAQQNYLRNHGISKYVMDQMLVINGSARPTSLNASGGGRSNPPGSVISVPALEPFPLPAPP